MKTAAIQIRLTQKAKRACERAASREEVSLSEWARVILAQAVIRQEQTGPIRRGR